MFKNILLITSLFFTVWHLSAQTYNMTNSTVSTCSGTFYDNGGLGNYTNSVNLTMTFCNSTPGQPIYISFSSFALENFFDYLNIYNGPNTGSPSLGSFTGTNSPGIVVGSSGCITLNFVTDGSVTYAGWVATISCTPPPPPPCITTIPLCGQTSTLFTGSQVSVGSFGCLGAIYNPTYYTIQPTTVGNLTITISSGCDVDFALWGPFSSIPCNMPTSATIDCSFSAAATEFADIASTVPGQYYLLLVSNFCNVNTNVNLNPTGSAAAGLMCGCGLSATAALTAPIACNGGTTSINVTGNGAPSYNYAISPAAGIALTGSTFSNVPAGNYTITVTNATNLTCSTTVAINVPQPAPLTATATGTAVLCNGGTSNITVNPSGGTPGYQYSLNGGAYQSLNTFNVLAGTYTITVKDANNCTTTVSVTTSQPANSVGINAAASAILCNGGTSTIILTGNGGTPNYQYSINGGALQVSNAFTVLAGTYTCLVSDANGCTSSTSVTIAQPLGSTVSATVLSPILCNGGTGALQGTASGVAGAYTFTWNTIPAQFGATATNVPAGNYTLTVADTNNCITTANVSLTEPTAFTNTISQTPVACNGGNTGTAAVVASGGTVAYSYSWDSSPSQNTATATGLSIGTYTCYLTDANGCTTTNSVIVTEPNGLNLSASATSIVCNNGTSDLTLTVNGGTPAYQYNVNGGAYQAGNVFSGLGVGTYIYSILDANGCSLADTITLIAIDTVNPVLNNCPANILTTNDLGLCGAAITWVAPTTTDNCSANIVQTQGTVNGSVFPLGTSTIEYTATDPAGNVAICTFTITISDTEAPVINGCPANISVNNDIGICGATVTWLAPTATDNCAANIVQTQGAANSSIFPIGVSNIQYTATDASGNVSLCNFTITVTDTELPVITACPTNISVNNDLGICGAVVTWAAPTTTDNCAANIVQTQGPASGTVFPLGISNMEYTATDASGNVAVCAFTINVTDSELPVIAACPTNISVNNDVGICGAVVTWVAPTISDNCPNPVILQTQGAASGTIFPLGISNMEYTATDANGNVAICTFTITVTDTENPVIVACPTNIVVGNDAGICGATVAWTAPTTSDNCAANIAQTLGLANASIFPSGTSTIEYTATDASGNVAICTFTITVTDPELPVINGCPANIVATNDAGICGAVVTWIAPTTTDNCAANIVQTAGLVNGSVFPIGVSNIQYTATDASGNVAVCDFTITITDTENPVIVACPANFSVNNDLGICGAALTWAAPTTTDNCAANVVQTQGLANGSIFPLGISNIEYTTTDASGNAAVCTFTINVTDTELPVIAACPTNIAVSNDLGICGAVVTWATPTVLDNCPNPVIVQTQGATSGTVFPLGISTIEYTATDANGNVSLCTFTITVSDSEFPVITACPLSISVTNDAGICGAVVTWTAPTTTDNCSANIAQTQGAAIGTVFPLGLSTIAYTATDASGNQAVCTFTITVTDPENPVINGCPANIVLTNDAGVCGAAVTWTAPTTTDNCSANIVQTQGGVNGSIFPMGVSNIQYTATDASGNTAICNFTISITDTENPVIVACPTNIVVNNDLGVCGASVTWTAPTTTDNCSANIAQTQGLVNGSVFPLGVSNIEYTATDASGNTAICTFSITITDTENPVLNACPTNIAVSNDLGLCGAVVTWAAPTTMDNCAANIVQTQGSVSGSVFPLGVSNIQYTATDASGNTAICTFNITITDTETPVIANCPVNISQNAGPNCDAVVNWIAPTVSDNCAGVSMTSNFNSGDTFPFTTTTVTYTATDAAGNTATCSFTVNLFDNTPPTIANCPANIVINLEARCDTTVTWAAPNITDNCSGLTVTQTHTSGDVFPLGVTNVNYTATDAAGNISTCDFTVTVIAPPAINASVSATTNPNCNGQNGSATVSVTGGSGAYNYSWNTIPAQNNNTATLPAGNYVAVVTDALAGTCVPLDTVQVSITQPAILAVVMSKNNLKCFADNSGDATATVSGGTTPYNYSWNNGLLTSTITNLAAGTYTVYITDAQGCTKTAAITLTQPDSLHANVNQTNVKCFGNSTGQAIIGVSGGTSPYNYNWTGGISITNIANNLAAGTYTVTVTDANLCTINRTFNIIQPTAPLTLVTSHTDALCFGTKTGTANVIASGGTPVYTYTWNSNPLQYGATATNLPAGLRTITVKDANNCIATATEMLGQPTKIDVKSTAITEPYCDLPNGLITVIASGGSSPYSYLWDDGQMGATADSLLGGSYQVMATDANNCADSLRITLTNTPPPTALFSTSPDNSEPILIENATIHFTNLSTGAVAYQWNFGDGFNDNRTNTVHTYEQAGIYTVTLTAYNAYYQTCPDSQSMTFEVIPNGTIFIPNVFTPNLDGENDEFFIVGTGIKELKCLIFDRWGKVVFVLQSPTDKWNGKNQDGKDLPEGTYTFKVNARLNDGKTLERGGTIMLLR